MHSWGYVKWSNNQVSAREPMIERPVFQGTEKSMCVGIPSFPIIIILGQVLNVCCVGFGWGKCLEEAVFWVYLISLGGNKDLYLQIMHFLWSAFVWALYTLVEWWVLCFALVGRATVKSAGCLICIQTFYFLGMWHCSSHLTSLCLCIHISGTDLITMQRSLRNQ